MENREKWIARTIVILAALACTLYGVSRGEVQIVMNKAVTICLECIGLG